MKVEVKFDIGDLVLAKRGTRVYRCEEKQTVELDDDAAMVVTGHMTTMWKFLDTPVVTYYLGEIGSDETIMLVDEPALENIAVTE